MLVLVGTSFLNSRDSSLDLAFFAKWLDLESYTLNKASYLSLH